MMRVSEAGRRFIERWEDDKLVAYRDTRGRWTIGRGHTGPEVVEGLRWTQKQSDDAFARDLADEESCVNRNVTVPLAPAQFDALVSFVHNVGCEAFRTSRLLKCVNAHDLIGAYAEFPRWNKEHVNGALRVNAGLSNRRLAELALFKSFA